MERLNQKDVNSLYRKIFDGLHGSSSGLVHVQDVANTLTKLGNSVTVDELQNTLSKVTGTAETTNIVFEEFAFLISELNLEVVDVDDMSKVFNYLDKDGDGFISPESLRELLTGMGEDISQDDLDDMIKEADSDGDGKVSLQDFVNIMSFQASNNGSASKKQANFYMQSSYDASSDEDSFSDDQMSPTQFGKFSTNDKSSYKVGGKRLAVNMKRRMSCLIFGDQPSGSRRFSQQMRPRSRSSCGNLALLIDPDVPEGNKIAKKRRSFSSTPAFVKEFFRKKS